MLPFREAPMLKSGPQSSPVSGYNVRRGRDQQQPGDGQNQGGRGMQHMLQEVAGTSELLKSCILAREKLGAAKMRILGAREERREASTSSSRRRTRRRTEKPDSPTVVAMQQQQGGSWEDGGGGSEMDLGGVERGEEELAALAAALPLSREFADKMAELAAVAPGLSRSLVGLTAVTISAEETEGEGVSVSHPGSGDTFKYLQELTKVAPPAIARLLSFEHHRASECTVGDLVQALVNLYVGVGSGLGGASPRVSGGNTAASLSSASPSAGSARSTPGVSPPSSSGSRASVSAATSSASSGSSPFAGVGVNASMDSSRASTMSRTEAQQREKLGKKAASWVVSILKQAVAPKVYGGKLVRSKGLDELLGKSGIGAAQHSRAVQNELLKNAEVLQGLAASDIGSRRRFSQQQRSSSMGGVSAAAASAADDADNHNNGRINVTDTRQQSGYKRPRLSAAEEAAEAAAGAAATEETEKLDNPRPFFGNPDFSVIELEAGARAGADSGATRLFRGGFGVEGGGRGRAATMAERKDPSELLLETTVEAFCSMLGTEEGTDRFPTQLFRARLQQDSYRLLAPPNRWKMSSPSAAAASAAAVREVVPPPGPHGKENEGGAPSSLSPSAASGQPPPRHRQSSAWPSSAATPDSGGSSHPGTPMVRPCIGTKPPPKFPCGSLLFSTHPPPPTPAEWETLVRDCLSALRRRPLLCPDALLRETGAAPSPPSEVCMRGVMAGDGGDADGEDDVTSDDGGSRSGSGSARSRRFRLSEASLMVGLSVVEEAVLEDGGGEAAAGLLRAMRTVRYCSGGVGGINSRRQALAGGGRGHVKGGDLFLFVELLEQTPSGCVEKSLDVLLWALNDLTKQFGRSLDTDQECKEAYFGSVPPSPPPSLERPFETELWLLVLGYRHWIMVAMVYLLSTDTCPSCTAAHDTGEGQRKTGAVRLLAWYVSGGFTKPPQQAEFEKAEAGVRRMAACLADCNNDSGDALTPSSAGEAPSSASVEVVKTGDASPVSPAPAGVRVTEALEAAGEAGQGLMGAVFSPCLAVAWLLSSRVALRNCESVLRRSVLREEDLDVAFRVPVAAGSSTLTEALGRSSCLEGVLQGLAALEDMVWLCGLSPAMSHLHKGRDLKALLMRTRAWVSKLGGHLQGTDRMDFCAEARDDFTARTAAISRSFGRVLDEM